MYESDANNPRYFHTMPDHIKKILYLDTPDLIVELDLEPFRCHCWQEQLTWKPYYPAT